MESTISLTSRKSTCERTELMFTDTRASEYHMPGPRQPALLVPRLSTLPFVPAAKPTLGGPQPYACLPDRSLSKRKEKKRADSAW